MSFDMSKVVDLYDEQEMLGEIDAHNLILDKEKNKDEKEDGEKGSKKKKERKATKE